MYLTGKNTAGALKIKSIGDSGQQGPGARPFYESRGLLGPTGVPSTGTLAAYDPATGLQTWYTQLRGLPTGGSLVTAGDVVFQSTGAGDLDAFDARSGKELFHFTSKDAIRADPLTNSAGGRQYVTIVASTKVLTFGLP